ncbi:hypothetical protein MBQ70_005630, partial [Klebsiella pneumoniae]|nr:hypothetical protein [Klebsiella pneumoniae]
VPDLLQPRQRSSQATQYVAMFSAESDAICCVPPLPRDRPLTTLKGRFAYSLTVVYFRKLGIAIKVGSGRNGHPVI